MRWSEVVEKYEPLIGKEGIRRMKDEMGEITLTMYPDGEANIPENDIDRAYRVITGKPTNPEMWD